MKTAIITGISGMDAGVMAGKLLSKGFQVYGMARQSASPNYWRLKEQDILSHPNFKLFTGDLTDPTGISNITKELQPDWILNFAAMSEVGESFKIPVTTSQTNALGPLYFLEAIRQYSPNTRFYTAGSSEMFGNSIKDNIIGNELTPMLPVSIYGLSKLFSHHAVRIYRETFGIFACSGILFNHSCKFRGNYFIEKKIGKYVAQLNKESSPIKLKLGNLDASRDIGYSPEFMDGIISMLEQDIPNDYILCTGIKYSIRQMLEMAFGRFDLDWQDYVEIDSEYLRPNELNNLIGSYDKAEKELGWKPSVFLPQIMNEIIDYELKR